MQPFTSSMSIAATTPLTREVTNLPRDADITSAVDFSLVHEVHGLAAP